MPIRSRRRRDRKGPQLRGVSLALDVIGDLVLGGIGAGLLTLIGVGLTMEMVRDRGGTRSAVRREASRAGRT